MAFRDCFARDFRCAAQRYKVGDRVRLHPTGNTHAYAEVRIVEQVRCVPEYLLRGAYTWVPENEVVSADPVICAPDGSRCAWMQANNADDLLGSAIYCKMCGGKLRR